MRLAVLSDIHSNYHAFRVCADWIYENAIDGILFAGDYVSDCPYPRRTLELIEELREKYHTWFVRGNREDTVLEKSGEGAAWTYPEGSIRYTVERLEKRDLDFFQAMPHSCQVRPDRLPMISVAHGDFHSTRSQPRPENGLMLRLLEEAQGEVHICGHSHYPFLYAAGGKLIMNPGSVGIPVNGTPGAEMGVLESSGGHWKARLLRLDYDIEAELADFRTSGLEDAGGVYGRTVRAILRTGRHYTDECIGLVARYAAETGESFDSRELWERAAAELGI